MRKLWAMTHAVAVLALDGVIPFDLGIPARVFAEALGPDGRSMYEVRTCSVGGRMVQTNHDISIVVDHDEHLLRRADTVIIATQEPARHCWKPPSCRLRWPLHSSSYHPRLGW